MRIPGAKRRSAWLITWEGVEYSLADLHRPRVVAILKSRISDHTIEKVLPILFTSESRLTFADKIGVSFLKQKAGWLQRDFNGRISCGTNPHLWARRVKNLYVELHDDSWDHQTLHWTELARYDEDPQTLAIIEAAPEYQRSEEVRFETIWSDAYRPVEAEV